MWLLALTTFARAQVFPKSPQISVSPGTPPAKTREIPSRPVSLESLPAGIVRDQKPIWLFPVRAVEGRHWKPVLGFTLATAGLAALDAHETPYFRRTAAFSDFNRALSGRNTALGIAAVPLATYVVGLARKDSFARETALLAGEAAADSQILALVMKTFSRRLRPSSISPDGDFGHTWFKSNHGVLGSNSSFPSGHTIAAFSIATVFAERYRRHRWVPWVAYGLAGLVGFSRMTLQSHFPSDVFVGAVLGYSISHFVVLRRP